jgi:hypothetical protein
MIRRGQIERSDDGMDAPEFSDRVQAVLTVTRGRIKNLQLLKDVDVDNS